MSGYIQTGPNHTAYNYNLAISLIDAGNFTGSLIITGYNVYYDAFNISTQKILGTIIDSDIQNKSQVYMNSGIIDIFKDQYFRVKPIFSFGEGQLSNYTLLKRIIKVPEGYFGAPQIVYYKENKQNFVIDWTHQVVSKFLTFYQFKIYNEYQNRSYDIQADCNGSSPIVISQKKCEIAFSKLQKYQFDGGERIITSIDYCNPNGCNYSNFQYHYPEIRYFTVPFAAPMTIQVDASKTTFTSIAFIWSSLNQNMKGSGGLDCDYKIWYSNNDTVTTKIILTNSTNGSLQYQTSTKQFIHKQYTLNIFEIQPFNYLGDGKISGNLTFQYDVPKQPSAPYKGELTNKTVIHIKFNKQDYNQSLYQNLVSYDIYQKDNTDPASQYVLILKALPPNYSSYEFISTQNIINGHSYLFKYQTQNYVGYSSFSPEILIQVGLPPTPQGNILTSNEMNFIKISWEQAFNLQELPLSGFNIQILDNNGSWNTTTQLIRYCNNTNVTLIQQMFCIIPIQVFSEVSSNNSSLQLKPGSIIQPKVTVYNVIGSSSNIISMSNKNAIVIESPKQPTAPIKGELTNKTVVHIKFNQQEFNQSGYQDIVSYDFYQKDILESSSQYALVFKAMPPSYNQFEFIQTQNIINGHSYMYKYQSKNYMGYSSFSPEILIQVGLPPSPQGTIITTNELEFVKISWEKAFNLQELPLIGFSIQILDKNGSWTSSDSLKRHCNNTNTTIIRQMYCIVPVQIFNENSSNNSGFQLQPGQIIQPNVTVQNVIGYSSNVINMKNTNTIVVDRPKQPSAPINGELTNKTVVHIKFNQQEFNQSGYQDIVSYDFYQKDISDLSSQYVLIYKALSPNYNKYEFLTQNIINGHTYMYKYQTQNYMGYSSFSPEIRIRVGLPPTPQGSITTQNELEFVKISWDKAFNFQELPVLNFSIYILDNNGSWSTSASLKRHCNNTNTTIIRQMYCIVPIQVFTEVYSNNSFFQLKPGTIIQANVTVQNLIGSSSNTISMMNTNAIVFDKLIIPKYPISVIESLSNTSVAYLSIQGQTIYQNYNVSYSVFQYRNGIYELIYNLDTQASVNIGFIFSYNISQTYNFSYSIDQFGRSLGGYYNNSITFQKPSSISWNLEHQRYRWQPKEYIYIEARIPQINQFSILDYQIQVLDVKSQWKNIESFVDQQTNWNYQRKDMFKQFTIDIGLFQQNPFNLLIGHNIKIRTRVKNFVGWSDFDYSIQTIKVKSKPSGRVYLNQNLTRNDFEAIEITWTQLEFPEDGGDSTTGYTVYWGEGSQSAEWKLLVAYESPVFKANTRDFGIKLNPQSTYKFKVQAFNSYGAGPESYVFYAMTPQKNQYTDSKGVNYLFASFLALIYSYC